MPGRTVLITGASGNLGGKLRRALQADYSLRLLDREKRDDPYILQADLSHPGAWQEQFRGVEVVFHFAADPLAQQTWPALIAPNLDAMLLTYQTAVACGVRRFVYASSNHVMGGYRDRSEPHLLTTDLPPLPGLTYVVDGQTRDSRPYAATKLFGERVGHSLAQTTALEVIAVRLGWNRVGDNRPEDVPASREAWFRLMWLSNGDFVQLMQRCLEAELSDRFTIVHGMSDNAGMRWDLSSTRSILGYQPRDGLPAVDQQATPSRS